MTIKTTQGSRYRGFLITFKDRVTGTAVPLTGATLTGRIVGLAAGSVARDIDGTFDDVDLANGQARWNPGVADVGTAGVFEIRIDATIGGLVIGTFRERFEVEAEI